MTAGLGPRLVARFLLHQLAMAIDLVAQGLRLLRPMLEGHAIVFRVRATEIIETNGILSNDGKQAQRVTPVSTLLDDDPDHGAPFVTVIRRAR